MIKTCQIDGIRVRDGSGILLAASAVEAPKDTADSPAAAYRDMFTTEFSSRRNALKIKTIKEIKTTP
ncbi:hypothetical protein HUK80_07175 [Flavobacterium sp. MAH-1]|uniref:Uncharacterized protein n=1 Tax=Flavobacterium agri TaxID=2743471 RepID=A0A7Y9C580_9FLAO|nr:hypothetical protein [Flavobacterium agri]NUY80671.1 hypothetical protein [Flavobacterium agri]NYA70695.1 hypothetical protein [Flavobacterium agri]